ncbi:MAG TPA: FAD-dependent oxidoreductase [Candidatus Limnocylindria bacterium]
MADFDLIIIGGGPAGLTAGLYAARANMSTILFEAKDIGGELLNTDLIEDWPGEESITGRALAEKMGAHATKFGLKIQPYSPVKKIRSDGDWKVVEMDDGTIHRAYAVIVTVGGEPTKLEVPGEAEFHGRGVSYCAVCDGAFFKGEDLAVIGGGDSAFQEGLFLTRFAKSLRVVHRRNEFRAQSILQDRLLGMDTVKTLTPATVKEIGGDTQVRWMDVERDGAIERIPVGGVFVFIGFKPVGRHLFDEHIDHDENGYLLTDQYMRTNIPGVYACGDTRAQLAKQVTTAVGDATTAVLHAERYIEELKHMRRSFPDVPSATLEREVERMKIRRFLAGQTIIREGDPAESFFLLTRGAASVRQNGPHGETEVSTLKAGDFFGEIGLLSGTVRNATVRATAPSEALELDAEGFRDLVESSQLTKDRLESKVAHRLASAGPKT